MTGWEPAAPESLRSALSSEDGGVLVMVAVALPVILLFASFVVDIGNWFAHDRHLQTQADAAAFAGAAEYRLPCDGTVNDSIQTAAQQYSGDEAGDYNQQVGTTPPDQVHFVLNDANFYGEGNHAPADDTVVEGDPCEAGMVDVKMTETDLPLFFQIAGLITDVDFINSHARVEFFQRDRFTSGLPIGVPDPNPRVARAYFIDEVTGEELGSVQLTRNGTDDDLAIWDNEGAPLSVNVDSKRIGVRIALGGATSTTCGDPLVECYDLEDENLGLLHVRGYSSAGSGAQPNPPLARSVYLTPGTCPDPYFNTTADGCTVGLHADVDFGTCGAANTLPDVGAKLTARVGNAEYALSPVSCDAGTSTSGWETSGAPIPVGPSAGPIEVQLDWEETKGTVASDSCKVGGGNKCKGSFGVVQRTYSASADRSGPIHAVQLFEGGAAFANSLEACSDCTYDLVVKVGIDLNLAQAADSVDDPIVNLRFAAPSGSQNQALDCDPDIANLRDEIASGCEPVYTRNGGTACPDTATLWNSTAQPWSCVALQTGDATGQVWQGLNQRIHGDSNPPSCVSPNNWADFPNLDPGDPRIVPLFITPFGVFSGSGSGTVPVSDFAVFYATGWHNSQTTCPDDDPAPAKSMVGHFIKYVQAFNDGTAGEEHCTLNELGSCVAVLTK